MIVIIYPKLCVCVYSTMCCVFDFLYHVQKRRSLYHYLSLVVAKGHDLCMMFGIKAMLMLMYVMFVWLQLGSPLCFVVGITLIRHMRRKRESLRLR